MSKSLKTRKLELVRDTIYDTAMGLFSSKGFSETTMEEIAEAAGVSLRTVFRYFPTKNDLFGFALHSYGDALAEALASASPAMSAQELLREVSFAGVVFATSQSRLRLVMEITRRNRPARQAFATGLVEIEDRLVDAFARRMKTSAIRQFQPRMLAILTQMAVSLTVNSWVAGEFKEPAAAHRNVFSQLVRLYGSDASHLEIKSRGSFRKTGDEVTQASNSAGR